jgi:hypothetical protein
VRAPGGAARRVIEMDRLDEIEAQGIFILREGLRF